MKEVIEAREDLLALWNPDRLSDHPRLRSKSSRKTREISEAYDLLMEGLGRTGSPKTSKVTGPSAPEPEGVGPRTSPQPSASLLHEVFSEKMTKGSRQIFIWAGVTLVIIASLAISYFLPSAGSAKSEETVELSAAPETSPLELPAPDQELEVAFAPSEAKAEGNEAENKPKAVPEKRAKRASAPPSKKLGSTPTPNPVPSVREGVKNDASPERNHSETRPAAKPQRRGPQPILLRDQVPFTGKSADSNTPKEPSPEEQEKYSEEAEKSYRILLAHSSAARALVEGGFEALRFAQLKVVRRKASELWLDLTANQSNGKEVHFIWSVNVEDQTVRPLSEAARNLDRDGPPTE